MPGLLTAAVLGAALLPASSAESEAKPVAVPFDLLITKHMVVDVKINGKGPYRVIFDTGAPVSLVTSKVATATGLLAKNARRPAFSLFATAGMVNAKTVELGALKAENVPVIVMDHPTVEAISQVLGPVEGILGFPFFARYKMTLDYQAKQMTFVPNGYDPPDVLQALMASIMSLPADRQSAAKVLAPAALWGMAVHKDPQDENAGVTVRDVLPGSAAAKAGLRPGDRLLTLDGRWTDTVVDCYRAAGHVKPGTAAAVRIKRGSQELDLSVTPLSGL
jgi:hypothetical protein